MRKYVTLMLVCFLSTFQLWAQQDIVSQGDKAYMEDDFSTALELYEDALKLHGSSAELYFNMGNTCYRLGDMGHAVLYYKKALKLNPSFSDARTNLDFVQTKLIDQQISEKSLSKTITENIVFIMTPNAWAVVGILFFIIFLFALSQYILADTVKIRKIAFFGGIFSVILATLTTIAAFYTSGMARSDKEAVIIVPVAKLSTVPREPSDKSQLAFTLHEGTLVEIVDSVSVSTDSINPVWLEVKVNKEHRAWIPSQLLERI